MQHPVSKRTARVVLVCFTVVLSLSLLGCGGAGISSLGSGTTSNPGNGGNDGNSGNDGSGGGDPQGNSAPDVKTFSDLQQADGWTGYALLPPKYAICETCSPDGPEARWSMTQGLAGNHVPLLDNAARFDLGNGDVKFADILWNNHLIGDFSSQGMPDSKKTLIPTLHHFVYDVYFYAENLPVSQAVEFDINQFFGGKSFIWGHECRIAGGHEWDTWDNAKQIWIPSGIPCNPKNNAWNHVVIEVERTSDDRLLFKSIALNGEKATVNRYDNPTPKSGWYGVTINYQQDGNRNQDPYSIWLDKLNFSYW